VIVPPPFGQGQRIGLFGGSFNPAHHGHYAVALYALHRLRLDSVWWLVAAQNPLKDARDYSDYAERLEVARKIASHPRFVVTDIEKKLGTLTTASTLAALDAVLSRGRFVWIMGADSFANLHRWNDWTAIPESLPIAVMARPGFSTRALHSPAALRYARYRVAACDAPRLADRAPPAWVFIPMPLRRESSSAIRRTRHSGVTNEVLNGIRRHLTVMASNPEGN
jgi:nicotinate-nucleotide adenylyltransferase